MQSDPLVQHVTTTKLEVKKLLLAARPAKCRTTLKEMENDESGMVFPCTVPNCGAKFSRREHLKRHLRSHTGERPHPCSICGRDFTRSDNMRQHMLTHQLNPDDTTKRYKRKSRAQSAEGGPFTATAIGFGQEHEEDTAATPTEIRHPSKMAALLN